VFSCMGMTCAAATSEMKGPEYKVSGVEHAGSVEHLGGLGPDLMDRFVFIHTVLYDSVWCFFARYFVYTHCTV
jgi:hypothetical protein